MLRITFSQMGGQAVKANNSHSLPNFDLEDYGSLLTDLMVEGYGFEVVSRMREWEPGAKTVYLRHDVDLHIAGLERLARLEKGLGIPATYYVPLALHFNPMYPENRCTLCELIALGHEIGLHYSMETYSLDPIVARRQLDWECGILATIVGQPIRTICMHQPHTGQLDPFRSLEEYVHPHDPRHQTQLLYVSDSCRAWRDETLLECFGSNPPDRLLLLVHGELWMDGQVRDRMRYLREVLTVNGVRQNREYFERIVRRTWETHPAPKQHDQREG
jgi:hypothetical protein